jgi:hypothetical protein
MPLYLNEDQAMLRETARDFMAEEGAIKKQLRKYRDMGCKDGFGHALWRQFGELGFTGILVPEEDGGVGLGHVEAGIVLEEIGRNLTPSPFLVTAVAAVEALRGSAARERWLRAFWPGRPWPLSRSTRDRNTIRSGSRCAQTGRATGSASRDASSSSSRAPRRTSSSSPRARRRG